MMNILNMGNLSPIIDESVFLAPNVSIIGNVRIEKLSSI